MLRGTTVAQFLSQLAESLAQLESFATAPEAGRSIWLGQLFQPEAYLTATRQTIAHKSGWSLEQLVLNVDIDETGGEDSFEIKGSDRFLAFSSQSSHF